LTHEVVHQAPADVRLEVSRGGESTESLGIFNLAQEVPDDERDVLPPIPKRRRGDLPHEARAKFGPEVAVVLLGRPEKPNVGTSWDRFADRLIFIAIERPQELGLRVERKVGDLVEEQGAVRGREEADARRRKSACSRERVLPLRNPPSRVGAWRTPGTCARVGTGAPAS
jgi:hypothetical protein